MSEMPHARVTCPNRRRRQLLQALKRDLERVPSRYYVGSQEPGGVGGSETESRTVGRSRMRAGASVPVYEYPFVGAETSKVPDSVRWGPRRPPPVETVRVSPRRSAQVDGDLAPSRSLRLGVIERLGGSPIAVLFDEQRHQKCHAPG